MNRFSTIINSSEVDFCSELHKISFNLYIIIHVIVVRPACVKVQSCIDYSSGVSFVMNSATTVYFTDQIAEYDP